MKALMPLAACLLGLTMSVSAIANTVAPRKFPLPFKIPVDASRISSVASDFPFIVVRQDLFRLFVVTDYDEAIVYPIALPKNSSLDWEGVTRIIHKQEAPPWMAPPAVVRRSPELKGVWFPGGAWNNPMGAAALLLEHGGNREYAIHGTAVKYRNTIGTRASSGCIRMYDEDAYQLFRTIGINTTVINCKRAGSLNGLCNFL